MSTLHRFLMPITTAVLLVVANGCAQPPKLAAKLADAPSSNEILDFYQVNLRAPSEFLAILPEFFGVKVHLVPSSNMLAFRGDRQAVNDAISFVAKLDDIPICLPERRMAGFRLQHADPEEIASLLREMESKGFFQSYHDGLDGRLGIVIDKRLNMLLIDMELENEMRVREIIAALDKEERRIQP